MADALSNPHPIAHVIETYWRERGHTNVRCVLAAVPGVDGAWSVRSNLVGGLPPGVTSRTLRRAA